jgi:hypothetical protein
MAGPGVVTRPFWASGFIARQPGWNLYAALGNHPGIFAILLTDLGYELIRFR